jgi:hypothetical protein
VYLIRKDLSLRIADYDLSSQIQWATAETSPPTADSANLTMKISLEYDPQLVTAHRHSLRIDIYSPDTSPSSPSLALTLTHPLAFPRTPQSPHHPSAIRELCSEIQTQSIDFDTQSVSMSASLPRPSLWTAETPSLYVVVMTILRDETTEIDVESCCLGIKEVSISGKENQLCVNRVPLLIAGVNHHEFHPNTGRSVSKETMLQDIHLLKEFNFNAVRLSHYPHHHTWLELCSRHGLYVIDECNIETHGFQWSGQAVGYLSSQTEWLDAHVSRVIRMYERDKNMTAIIGWSLGNESGVGEAHRRMYRWLKSRDLTGRFVQYESGGATSEVTDIICPMYLRPDWCLNQALHDSKRRPVILCEYAHAMGNSSGGLAHYWKCFHDSKYPRLQGGFIWDFVDQGLSLSISPSASVSTSTSTSANGAGNDSNHYGYGGDFGDIPNTAQFCINGIFSPHRLPHPIAYEAAALQSPIDFQFQMEQTSQGTFLFSLSVHNHRSFLNLSDVILQIDLESTTVPLPTHSSSHSLLFLKNLSTIAPRSSQTVDLTMAIECAVDSYLKRLQELTVIDNSSSVSAPKEVPLEYWISISAFSNAFSSDDISQETSKRHLLKRLSFTHPLLPLAMETRLSSHLPSPQRTIAKMSPSEVTVFSSDHSVTVNWSNGNQATLQQQCGSLISWKIQGNEILKSPLELCLWRAPTDNDRSPPPPPSLLLPPPPSLSPLSLIS